MPAVSRSMRLTDRGIYWVLATVLAAAGLIPEFRSLGNLANVATQSAALAVLALGQTFVILCGLIDLSVGQLTGLIVVLVCDVAAGRDAMTAPVLLLALGLGAGSGAITGLLNNRLRIHPLILTFGTMSVLQGIVFTYTDRGGRPADATIRIGEDDALEDAHRAEGQDERVDPEAVVEQAGDGAAPGAEAKGEEEHGSRHRVPAGRHVADEHDDQARELANRQADQAAEDHEGLAEGGEGERRGLGCDVGEIAEGAELGDQAGRGQDRCQNPVNPAVGQPHRSADGGHVTSTASGGSRSTRPSQTSLRSS